MLSGMSCSPEEGTDVVRRLLQAQELLRSANAAVMADNFKACYI